MRRIGAFACKFSWSFYFWPEVYTHLKIFSPALLDWPVRIILRCPLMAALNGHRCGRDLQRRYMN